jgi:alpha-glucosidase
MSIGARAEAVSKKFIELRYSLMPYLYNQYYKAHKEGIPVMRPMILEYPEDANVIDMYSQFMFGDDILVAPVLYEGEREKLVYLPNGNWYDYFAHREYKGGRYYNLNVPLENTVVLVKEGSIIPVYEEKYNYVGEKELEITLEVFKGTGSLEFYEDDGISFDYKKGGYNLYRIESRNDTEQKIDINMIHKGLECSREFKIIYI